MRQELSAAERTPLERQFLPAALEIMETPAPALPRAILWTMIAALVVTVIWATLGHVDMIAVAGGKVIAADRAKVIQPAETAVIKRILVADGQTVKAGQILIELEAAATATGAETARTSDALVAAQLEAARYDALARGAGGTSTQIQFRLPEKAGRPAIAKALIDSESRAMASQYFEHRAKLAALDAEITRRIAELGSSKELVAKLTQTLPMAQRRADDYKNLMAQKFVTEHAYLEKEQARIEQERDLAYQRSRITELAAAIDENRRRRESLTAGIRAHRRRCQGRRRQEGRPARAGAHQGPDPRDAAGAPRPGGRHRAAACGAHGGRRGHPGAGPHGDRA